MAVLNDATVTVGLYPEHYKADRVSILVSSEIGIQNAFRMARAVINAPTGRPSAGGGFIPVSPGGPR